MFVPQRMTIAALAVSIFAIQSLSGCATIVHGGPRSIPVSSTPPGASVTIYNQDGKEVSRHTTPFVAKLTTKNRYFKSQSYRMVFELPGHKSQEVQLQPKVSGWYFSNLLFGGLIGMLIVDPLTGAMYNLTPNKIEQSLSAETAEQVRRGETLVVILKSQATPGELNAMTRIAPQG